MKVDGLRPVPVVVVTLATVALPAGCGGGDDGAGDSGGSAVTEEAARGKSAGRTSDGPLEAAGLESVAVAEADLPEIHLHRVRAGHRPRGQGEAGRPGSLPAHGGHRAALARTGADRSGGPIRPPEDGHEGHRHHAVRLWQGRRRRRTPHPFATRRRTAPATRTTWASTRPSPLSPTATRARPTMPSPTEGSWRERCTWYRVVRSGPHVAVFGWQSLVAHKNAGESPDEVIAAQLEKLTESAGTDRAPSFQPEELVTPSC